MNSVCRKSLTAFRAASAVAGNYIMVAMMLAMAEETVPPGKEPPFKVGEK